MYIWNPSKKVSCSDWWFSDRALCGWKDQFGNDSSFHTVSRCGQLLVYFPDFGPSPSFVFLSQPWQSIFWNLERPKAALPACLQAECSEANVSHSLLSICPRPSCPSCRHLYSVIFLAPATGVLSFALILFKGDPLGSGHCPISFLFILYKQPIYDSIHPSVQRK